MTKANRPQTAANTEAYPSSPGLPRPLNGASADRDDPRPATAVGSLLSAIARTEELIDLESDSLEHHRPVDLQEIGRRKTQSLLELTRLARALPRGIDARAVAEHLGAFRAKLERNAELLKLHLAATREVATVIANALHDAEWDGTYDRAAKRSGPMR
jgi:hypothetical protein